MGECNALRVPSVTHQGSTWGIVPSSPRPCGVVGIDFVGLWTPKGGFGGKLDI